MPYSLLFVGVALTAILFVSLADDEVTAQQFDDNTAAAIVGMPHQQREFVLPMTQADYFFLPTSYQRWHSTHPLTESAYFQFPRPLKRDGIATISFQGASPINQEPTVADLVGGAERKIRSPLGTMRFGKRSSNPLGTMRFGKRSDAPLEAIVQRSDWNSKALGTMRFGK